MSSQSDRSKHKQDVFLQMAQTLADLGTCDRAKVGALIVKDGRCISWGYNGAPPGVPHCSENQHGWTPDTLTAFSLMQDEAFEMGYEGEDPLNFLMERYGCKNATHAEANAVAFAARQGISTEGATLYVTVSPCETCARLLIAAGIVRVVFRTKYRDDSGIVLLYKSGVDING